VVNFLQLFCQHFSSINGKYWWVYHKFYFALVLVLTDTANTICVCTRSWWNSS
jgi:hypothetical protein